MPPKLLTTPACLVDEHDLCNGGETSIPGWTAGTVCVCGCHRKVEKEDSMTICPICTKYHGKPSRCDNERMAAMAEEHVPEQTEVEMFQDMGEGEEL